MDYLIICTAALLASLLTLFSGFGLGTLLMPVVAVFFPLETAIAMTAVVHLANNAFKLGLLGRLADRGILLRFGLPAVASALLGAWLLGQLSAAAPLLEYRWLGLSAQVLPLKLVIGALILLFVLLELWPRFAALALDRRWLPWGGLLSGFFGGLSGHQGAFRSAFLLKTGLGPQAFVATGAVLAVMVDMARLGIYGLDMARQATALDWPLLAAASLAAFAGAWVGARLLRKATLPAIRALVSALLMAIALGLMAGLL